ncbi:MAG: multiheme c-type cytochrome [Sulfurimonas sp.]|uniref:multiheme c-type cytochrome n=1 Tax=Sulfurimonas sp. TaxID=2022749 RepID=UPI0025F8249F|nr:multiheme c-type cytochrome [Sulfurimonas sp.]MCK9453846.1 cytochrome c family protein [Sulfurimonas sp.]
MKRLLLISILFTTLFAAKPVEIGEMFKDSGKCKTCHLPIVKEWEQSWHAKSHYNNNEYFRATTDYVSRKTRKSLSGVKVECATCHNPRISVTSTGIEHEIITLMGLNEDSEVKKALESDDISEGINCVVCHNIGKIHSDKDETVRGINRVEWTKSGVMVGPYDDARSPYHRVEHREYMDKDPNKLCFVCHANDRSASGFVFTNMQDEYKEGGKLCVDCHMGSKKQGVAATLRVDNGKAKQREIREHTFFGAHTQSMWKDALSLSLEQKRDETIIHISNPNPHNIPSGFGSREIVVEAVFKNSKEVVGTKTISLTTYYKDKRGKETIPHLAVSASEDLSIAANSKRVLKVLNEKDADRVEVTLYYRLVNDEVRSILELEDPIFSQRSFIASKFTFLTN